MEEITITLLLPVDYIIKFALYVHYNDENAMHLI